MTIQRSTGGAPIDEVVEPERVVPAPPGGGRSRIGHGLYGHVVDLLGQEIINGDLAPGSIVFAEQLVERLGVSRSVVRESLRTLSSMGLLESRPQVGTRVLPTSRWDLLNPEIVKWRGQGPDYVLQMRELLELRLGIEQAAARLAARRISPDDAAAMLHAAMLMREALGTNDSRSFFEADATFHRLLLEGTKNAVMAQLGGTIGAVLHIRRDDPRPGMHDLTPEAVDRHVELARALIDRDPERARSFALLLVEGTLQEVQNLDDRSAATTSSP